MTDSNNSIHHGRCPAEAADETVLPDFLLHKSGRRSSLYHGGTGVRYSDELRRWLVTSPDLIRQVILDRNFTVVGVDLEPMAAKLGFDMTGVAQVMDVIPLLHEGEDHRARREGLARVIARNSATALQEIETELRQRAPALAARPRQEPFCLYGTFLRPVIIRGLLALSGVNLDPDITFEILPQMLDEALPVSRRKKISLLTHQVMRQLPMDWPEEKKHLRASIMALGVNTLLGSISLTIVHQIFAHPDTTLCNIRWNDGIVRTSVPFIERRAKVDTTIGGATVKAGDSVRLYVEAFGLSPEGDCRFNDLFFGLGTHKCLGLGFSKQTWLQFVACLSCMDRKLRVVEVRERAQDYLFNFPERITVEFND